MIDKVTPGPWVVDGGGDIAAAGDPATVIVEGCDGRVAGRVADARLIAAAPELLDVADQLDRWHRSAKANRWKLTTLRTDTDVACLDWLERIAAMARAAVAKAMPPGDDDDEGTVVI